MVLTGIAVAHAAGFILVWRFGSFAWAILWLMPASAAAAWIYHRFRRLLPLNRHAGNAAPFPDLGPANRLTLLRGVLVSHLAGFALLPWMGMPAKPLPWPWVPGLLYGVAVILDAADGRVARRTGRVTPMGAALDMETDALGLLAASVVAVAAGQLPPAYLAAGLAYYLFGAGIRIRKFLGRPAGAVDPWQGARIIAGFQMVLAAAALLPPVGPPVTTLAAWIVMIPLLAGFARDWLIVSGHAANDCFDGARWGRWMYRWTVCWIPLASRLSAAAAGIAWTATASASMHGEAVVLVSAALLLAAGWMGRTAAAVMAWSSGSMIVSGERGASWEISVLFGCALIVLMAGTGPMSLWRPEDRFFFRGHEGAGA